MNDLFVDNRCMAQLENFRLKVFRAVAENLNFRKAAEGLFITQPAVTHQIKALEDDLGVRLFDRAANRVTLTAQGLVLLRAAKQIAAIVSKVEQELDAKGGKLSGDFALGVSTTIAQYVLPRLIGAFASEHPHVRLSLQSGNTAEMVQLVLKGKVSISLIEGPARHREVRVEKFMEDEMVLIANAELECDNISASQFLASTLLLREPGSGSRHVVQTALAKAGFKTKSFEKLIYLDSTEAIKSAVEAGLGIGFVSRWAIAKELELQLLKVVEVKGLRIARNFSLLSRSGPVPLGAAGAFRRFALERAELLSRAPAKNRVVAVRPNKSR
ncbi:MAG: LysR substrate-binding domain-containing protein [Candidatus Acidiferrum sp.]